MDKLKEQIGRMFVVGLYGTSISPEIIDLIHNYRVGNIILFSRNISTPAELKKLTADLQHEAVLAGYHDPLLITLDQENGIVKRLDQGFSHLPGAMAIGATDNPQNAFDVYRASAEELKQVGVNWNLAPVADVNNNPLNPVIGVRSFGENPQQVSAYVEQAVAGIQTENVMATLKHFPGHGDTQVDSHLDLPVIDKSLADLAPLELIPFERGIAAGVDCVMLAHLDLPQIAENGLPASLSQNVVNILRKQLHFEGVIATDDLEMKAIADRVGTLQAGLLAAENGCDFIMISHSHQLQRETMTALYEKATQDKSLAQKIQQAAQRIVIMAKKYNGPTTTVDFSDLVAKHQKFATKIYDQSLCANHNVFPTPVKKGDAIVIVSFSDEVMTGVEDRNNSRTDLAELFLEQGVDVKEFVFSKEENPASALAQLEQIPQNRPIIFVTRSIKQRQELPIKLITALVKETRPVTVVAVRNPYDENFIPNTTNFIATFEPTVEALQIAVSYMLGHTHANGHYPVTLAKGQAVE